MHVFLRLFDNVALLFVGSVSETAPTGTPLASESRITSSKQLPVDAESSKDKVHDAGVETKPVEWGNLLAGVYPLIKIMEVQVCYTLLLYVKQSHELIFSLFSKYISTFHVLL